MWRDPKSRGCRSWILPQGYLPVIDGSRPGWWCKSLRKNSVQKVSASEGPISMPSTSRRPSLLTARRGLRGVKLVLIFDGHEGIKAAIAKVLHAS